MSSVNGARVAVLALAEEMRGKDWAGQLEQAMAAAASAGWAFERCGAYACRLIFAADATPRDLREAARNPFENPGQPSQPTAEFAAARAALVGRKQVA